MVEDYKARKNEVLESYDKLEALITDLQEYSKKIDLTNPVEHLVALLRDIRTKAEKVKEDRFNIMIAGESIGTVLFNNLDENQKKTYLDPYI